LSQNYFQIFDKELPRS